MTARRRSLTYCESCGHPLRSDNSTGFCSANRGCLARARHKLDQKRRKWTRLGRGPRFCSECGGLINRDNVTGICSKSGECRRALRALATKRKKPESVWQSGSHWLLPPAYELAGESTKYALDKDGHRIEIVDQVAVDIMVEGSRRVASTLTERTEAAARMIKAGLEPQEVAEHIGTLSRLLGPVIEPLGYEVVPRISAEGKRTMGAAAFRKVAA